MEETILKAVLNFGVFPAVTIYLIFIIIKDFKTDMSALKNDTNEYYKDILKQYTDINQSLTELVKTNEQLQTYIINYLNSILLKLLDVLDDLETNNTRGNK